MGNFQGGDNRGGGFRGGNSGGRSNYGNRRDNRREITMHKAVCDECQKDCQVPFRPSSDKPIYCNDCFSGKRNDQPHREYSDRRPKKDFGNRENRAPAFSNRAPAQDDLKNQFRELNVKLDRLLSAVEKLPQSDKIEVKSKNKFTPTIGPAKKTKDTKNLKDIIKKAVKTKTVAKKKIAKKVSKKRVIKNKSIKKVVKKKIIKKVSKKKK